MFVLSPSSTFTVHAYSFCLRTRFSWLKIDYNPLESSIKTLIKSELPTQLFSELTDWSTFAEGFHFDVKNYLPTAFIACHSHCGNDGLKGKT